jgi:4-amino-4-deoxy-L-arabinose transferase-like glycosyltransferase
VADRACAILDAVTASGLAKPAPAGQAPLSLRLPGGIRALPRHHALLLALFLLALALRVWALGDVPPGLDPDEAALGYNAYSILRTGRDEHGALFPLLFESFGDYKRPVAIYAAVPFLAVLGATPLAIRLPVAVAGALSIVALYAVAGLLYRSRTLALVAAGLLVVSPWHLQFSRAAREVCWLLLAILTMVALLLGAAHARGRRAGVLLLLAALSFVVALYSYVSGPVLTPLVAVVLLAAYLSRWRRVPRAWLGGAALVALLGTATVALQFLQGSASARFAQVSVFGSPSVAALSAQRLARSPHDGPLALLQHPLAIGARLAVDGYLAHFDPTYLFTRGDAEWRHHSSDAAHLYLWDASLIAAGLWQAVKHWRRPAMLAAGGWLLVGPLPAAFAESAPHALRAIGMLPAWYLVAAAGARPLWRWLRRRAWQWDWLLLLALGVAYYLYAYHRYYPVEHGRAWSSGTAEAMRAAQVEVAAGRFDRAVISARSGFSYVQVLYATAYDPARYLAAGGTRLNPAGTYVFPPFELRDINFQTEPRTPGVLYVVGAGTGLPPDARVVQTIKDAAGRDAALLVSLPAGQPGARLYQGHASFVFAFAGGT